MATAGPKLPSTCDERSVQPGSEVELVDRLRIGVGSIKRGLQRRMYHQRRGVLARRGTHLLEHTRGEAVARHAAEWILCHA